MRGLIGGLRRVDTFHLMSRINLHIVRIIKLEYIMMHNPSKRGIHIRTLSLFHSQVRPKKPVGI